MTDVMDVIGGDLIFVARIALAGLLAFLVGWEREAQGSTAGDRTHALVAIATAAFTSIAVEKFPMDAGRIIQGTITGVGFLGGGMILREAGRVRGLTTAAGVWAVAAIGIMIGAGEYVMGVSLGVLIVLVLAKERIPLVRRIGHTSSEQVLEKEESERGD